MINNSIKEIFKEIFGNDDIHKETSIGNYENWDSLGHARLIVALEKKFAIKLSFSEIILLTSVNKIQEFLLQKGVL